MSLFRGARNKRRVLLLPVWGPPQRLSLPLSARVSRGCCCRRGGDADVPAYLVEAKEAQLPHHIQGTDPGPRGDLSSHLQTDFHDLQRIGENHLGGSGLQETRGSVNMDGRNKCRFLSSAWDELWTLWGRWGIISAQ